ncbi:hypothetical protein F5Y03DRAFT_396168 [Xylaria venustula]|nr:hypothetical protein F5Y03DRAFT_396168 [Xylaria venustula]
MGRPASFTSEPLIMILIASDRQVVSSAAAAAAAPRGTRSRAPRGVLCSKPGRLPRPQTSADDLRRRRGVDLMRLVVVVRLRVGSGLPVMAGGGEPILRGSLGVGVLTLLWIVDSLNVQMVIHRNWIDEMSREMEAVYIGWIVAVEVGM